MGCLKQCVLLVGYFWILLEVRRGSFTCIRSFEPGQSVKPMELAI